MIELALPVLAASLLGSAHCVGMCGPFVLFYSGQPRAHGLLGAHVAYHGGRLVTYVALGALAGAIGLRLDQAGSRIGLPFAAAAIAGVAMILWGLATLAATFGWRTPRLRAPAFLHAAIAGVLRAMEAQPPAARALAIGLLSTLLPCGWLHVYVATAAAAASPMRGMVVMAAFWAGTVPLLAAFGAAAQGLLGPLRRRLPAITAVALVVIGLLAVTGRIRPGRPMHHHQPAAVEETDAGR